MRVTRRAVILGGSTVLLCGVFGGCIDGSGNGSPGGDAGVGGGKALMRDYWPLALGNTWTYLVSGGQRVVQAVACREAIGAVDANVVQAQVIGSGTTSTWWSDDAAGMSTRKDRTELQGATIGGTTDGAP